MNKIIQNSKYNIDHKAAMTYDKNVTEETFVEWRRLLCSM